MLGAEAGRWELMERITFPYQILLDVVGAAVFIIAIAHLKREPGYWKR